MCLSLSLPVLCVAVKPYTPVIADPVLEPWRWREMEDLSDLGVLSMDEAADGSLWFGCIGGLVRYDGIGIEHVPFDEGLLSRIAHDRNRKPWGWSVLCLRYGGVLAVVDAGLVRWGDNGWDVIIRDLGSAQFETRMEQASDGTVWLLTSDGLWHFSEDLSEMDCVLRARGDQILTSFCRDPRGDVWVVMNASGESSSLIHIPLEDGRPREEQDWRSYPIDVDVPGRESSVCSGADGKIWLVDNNLKNPVRSLDPQNGQWETMQHPNSPVGYYSLKKDREGRLWGGGAGFLHLIQEAGGGFYSASGLGLPSSPLTLYETAEGSWWVIGRSGHVYTLDMGSNQWLTYVKLHFECDSPDGKQWFIGGNRRIRVHDPDAGTWAEYQLRDGTIDHPRSLHVSSRGLVWAVGSHEGRAAFCIFNGAGWIRHELPGFALMINGGGTFEAADGTLWFGAAGGQMNTTAFGGALQYEVTPEGDMRLLKHHASPKLQNIVTRFAQTPDGTLWLGSARIHRYDVESGAKQIVSELPNVFTYDLVADHNHALWAAKGLFGVYRKDDSGWRNYSDDEGLAGKFVVDLLPLRDGTLLAATDRGVSRFDGVSWAGRFLPDDFGMASRGGNMRQSQDGTVWLNFTRQDTRSPRVAMNIGGSGQFCTVRYKPDSTAPETFIGEHLEQVDAAGNIHVFWSGKDPWLNTPTDELYYSWRLNGGEWSPFSSKTERTFLALDSGRHTLEVRARDRDFNMDPTPALSRFTVVPPVWRQGWFIGMVLVIVLGTATFVWMLVYFHEKRLKDRARHLQEIDQIKTGFFTNISHELNTPLTSILIPLERIVKNENDAEKKKMLELVQRNAKRVAILVGQLIDFRKLEQGKVTVEVVEGDIVAHVRNTLELLQPIAQSRHVVCRMEGLPECRGWFDPEKLEKITRNLAGNAIKYTPVNGEVRIELGEEPGATGQRILVLTVEDTGMGIAPEHLKHVFERFYRVPEKSIVDGSGIGLNLTKDLVELQGGEILAESPIHPREEAPGSRFRVRLSMDRDVLLKSRSAHEPK